jgi:saposin
MHFSAVIAFLLLASFAAASNDGELDKCAWGESYWCSDLRVAKTCGAYQHCKTTVWANQKLPEDSSDVCKFCQNIVADVHTFIKEKKTEEDIANFLSSACTLIPSQQAANECKQLVKQYVPEIIDLITSELTPQVVCSLLKLCSGLEDTASHPEIAFHHVPLQKEASTDVKDTEICNDCKKFMSDIRNWLTSKEYEQQVEQVIDDAVCSFLGPLEKECKELVHEFLPQLINATAKYYDPNVICQPFCQGSMSRTVEFYNSATRSGSDESCLLCKTLLSELQALVRNHDIQLAIMKFLKADVCSHMGSYNPTCNAMIDRYAPTFFEILASILDPASRCKMLRFCPTNPTPAVAAAAPSGDRNVMRSAIPAAPEKTVTVKISPECVLCEFIMRELSSLLAKNATEVEIIAALDKVCSLLPSKIEQTCLDFVNTYGPAIIALLRQELDPAQVCTLLGLCTKTDETPVLVEKPVKDAEVCLVCETLVQYAEALLEQNATVTEIETVVKKICNYLPDTMKTQCTHIVDEYGPSIINFIATKYSPKEVCTLVKLCSGANGAKSVRMLDVERPVSSRLVGTNECSYGPAYWCASQQNAEHCGAVDHCKRYVWKQ